MKKKKMIKIFLILIAVLFLFSGCTLIKNPKEILTPRLPKVGDGIILVNRVKHIENNPDYIVRISKNDVRILIKTAPHDVGGVLIHVFGKYIKMNSFTLPLEGIYYIDIKTTDTHFKYYFKLLERNKDYYYGIKSGYLQNQVKPFSYNQLKMSTLNIGETWAKNNIIYYILIDRFRNGSLKNDQLKKITPWTSNWNKYGSGYSKIKPRYKRFYGGDLQGIIEKENYLKSLHINAISLSPPFYAKTVLKPLSVDFRHISPYIGFVKDVKENYVLHYNKLIKIIKKKSKIDIITQQQMYKYIKKFKSESIKLDFNNKIYNKFAPKKFNKQGINELKNLAYNSQTKSNGYGETLNLKTWGWTESDLLFEKLVSRFHKQGMRVILNVDLTYVSNQFWAFKQALINGPNSKFSKWFYFKDWNKVKKCTIKNEDIWNPYVLYQGDSIYKVKTINGKTYRRKWIQIVSAMTVNQKKNILSWNIKNINYKTYPNKNEMITLNYTSKSLQKYIIDSMMKWIVGTTGINSNYQNDDGIDGLSINFPYKLNQLFLKKLIQTVKTIKSNFYFVSGVTQGLPTNFSLSRKNYQFGKELYRFLLNKSINPTTFAKNLYLENLMQSENIISSQENIVDSVFNDRIFSMTINNNENYSTIIKNYRNIDPLFYNKDSIIKLAMMASIQMFFQGNVYIYYGDELGMWGGVGTLSQKPMLWNDLKGNYSNETDSIPPYYGLKVGSNKKALKFNGNVNVDFVTNTISYPVKQNKNIIDIYNKLLKIRSQYNNIYENSKIAFLYQSLNSQNDNVFAFEISNAKGAIIVVVNRGIMKSNATFFVRRYSGAYGNIFNKNDQYKIKKHQLALKLNKSSVMILKLLY